MSWRFEALTSCAVEDRPFEGAGFEHWLLVRRKRSTTAENAYYWVFAPLGSSLAELAAVAGLVL